MNKNIPISPRKFAESLRRLRRRRMLTQADLAEAAGVSARTIADLEKCKRDRVQEKTLVLLSKALDTTIEELLEAPPDEDGEPDPPARTNRLRLLVWIVPALLIAAFLIYRMIPTTNVDLETTDRSIVARDRIFGFVRWADKFEPMLDFKVIAPWDKGRYIVYGVEKRGKGGRLITRNIATGKAEWEVRDDSAPLDCIFEAEILTFGGFSPGEAPLFDDVTGDETPEMIQLFRHALLYPSYLSIFGKDGSRLFTYYNFGHLSSVIATDFEGDGATEILVSGTTNMDRYEGATLILLKRFDVDGAAVDSFATRPCDISDVADVRLVFPNFDTRLMDFLGADRLVASEMNILMDSDSRPIVILDIGSRRDTQWLVVRLDENLYPTGLEIADDMALLLRSLPSSARPGEGYFDEWLSKYLRFERGRLVNL